MTLREQLETAIQENTILLFTKGNKMFPRCGWSAGVIDIFKSMDVPFETIDIFDNPEIRPTLISISDWPTTPQIFVGGKFIGGGDIVQELHARGELAPLVEAALGTTEGVEGAEGAEA